MSVKQLKELNSLKIKLVKQLLEMPASTPSVAVQYEFAIKNLELDVYMEKLVLMVEVLKKDDANIAKMLLERMLIKKIPGFCQEVVESAKMLEVDLDELKMMSCSKAVRTHLKKRIVSVQGKRLAAKMMLGSKAGVLLMDYEYEGKIKKYLIEMEFGEARVIFMLRAKMIPTKENFRGRWASQECSFCSQLETDMHLFSCCGYIDLLGDVNYWALIRLQASGDEMSRGARRLMRAIERLELVHRDDVLANVIA